MKLILPALLGHHSGIGRAGSAGNVATGEFTALLIGLVFGVIFVEVNSGDLPPTWSFGLRAAGVMIAVILFVSLLWRPRWLDQAGQAASRFDRRPHHGRSPGRPRSRSARTAPTSSAAESKSS